MRFLTLRTLRQNLFQIVFLLISGRCLFNFLFPNLKGMQWLSQEWFYPYVVCIHIACVRQLLHDSVAFTSRPVFSKCVNLNMRDWIFAYKVTRCSFLSMQNALLLGWIGQLKKRRKNFNSSAVAPRRDTQCDMSNWRRILPVCKKKKQMAIFCASEDFLECSVKINPILFSRIYSTLKETQQ